MKVFTEREAEEFLKKHGFDVIETIFVRSDRDLEKVKFHFPAVLKVSSKKIVHKTRVNGVRLGIKSLNDAKKSFRELMKIKHAEGVLIQEQIHGEEYLAGLKKTQDFEYVVAFGKGGSKVEKEKKVNFRVCGVEGVNELSNNPLIREVLNKLCKISKDSGIKELDINPLVLEKGKALIVDSQIVFE
ncbi:MAG TPA: acetate--CoA ligase family protein [Candidatus Nanoarchaeia archaeon]|nr:acetate--CoA ligase family protein [Candidatus Nanoarchaeia archaeon]